VDREKRSKRKATDDRKLQKVKKKMACGGGGRKKFVRKKKDRLKERGRLGMTGGDLVSLCRKKTGANIKAKGG